MNKHTKICFHKQTEWNLRTGDRREVYSMFPVTQRKPSSIISSDRGFIERLRTFFTDVSKWHHVLRLLDFLGCVCGILSGFQLEIFWWSVVMLMSSGRSPRRSPQIVLMFLNVWQFFLYRNKIHQSLCVFIGLNIFFFSSSLPHWVRLWQ